MNKHDQRVRKQWLIMFLLSWAIAAINNLLQQLFDPFFYMQPLPIRYVVSAVSLLSLLGFGFIAHHCIYKKPGTKLLSFCLILTVITLVITPICYLTHIIHPLTFMPYYRVSLFVSQIMGIGWVIVCWKMRNTNKRLQVLEKVDPN